MQRENGKGVETYDSPREGEGERERELHKNMVALDMLDLTFRTLEEHHNHHSVYYQCPDPNHRCFHIGR